MLFTFSTLFIKARSSPLITESFKALEIKTSVLFNLDFANNTILSRFSFFFLIIDLYFLISATIAQIFNFIAELGIPIGIPSEEAKSEIELNPVIVEVKVLSIM